MNFIQQIRRACARFLANFFDWYGCKPATKVVRALLFVVLALAMLAYAIVPLGRLVAANWLPLLWVLAALTALALGGVIVVGLANLAFRSREAQTKEREAAQSAEEARARTAALEKSHGENTQQFLYLCNQIPGLFAYTGGPLPNMELLTVSFLNNEGKVVCLPWKHFLELQQIRLRTKESLPDVLFWSDERWACLAGRSGYGYSVKFYSVNQFTLSLAGSIRTGDATLILNELRDHLASGLQAKVG